MGEEERPFETHKVVVALRFERFQTMLNLRGGWSETRDKEIELHTFWFDVFQCIMGYRYTASSP